MRKTCAIITAILITNHLQLSAGKTCQPVLHKILYCAHEDEVSHLSQALPIWPFSVPDIVHII